MKAGLDIARIGQIAVPASDVKRAEAFYREVMGLKHLFAVEPAALSFFDCGGVRLMLDGNLRKDGKAAPGSILYFLVAEIEACFKRLAEGGAKIVDPPHLIARMPDHELWMGFFEDSEGNTLALMAELRP
jgi:methylmalonyl-CoA/ethylmalonyl-CoA epimerase